MVKNTKGGSSHKKLARKKEEENKTVKVDLNVNFTEYIIVLIDKNHGNCFSARLVHYDGVSKDYHDKELKVLHQRGRNALNIFKHTQSKLALVSIVTDFKLPGNAVGYVEEFIETEHLNAYLKNKKITEETYDKLSQYMTLKVEEVEDDKGGFEFDRSKPSVDKVKEESEDSDKKDEDIDVDAI
jgi:hypothetical protein